MGNFNSELILITDLFFLIVIVTFTIIGDGMKYVYNYQSVGRENIEQMKKLAVAGEGLNSFIMRNIKWKYATKFRDPHR